VGFIRMKKSANDSKCNFTFEIAATWAY